MKSSPSILFLTLLPLSTCWAFVTPSTSSIQNRPKSLALSAKKSKKKRSSSSGEGFGKSAPSAIREEETTASSSNSSPRALQSIDDNDASTSIFPARPSTEELNLDPNLSPEERSQAILRSKFGLKSYEEQQADLGDYRALLDAEAKKEKRDKLRNIDKLWPEDKDFVAILPPGIIKGIDTFLKLGLGVCTVAFLVAGVFITIEAGAKATASELPAGLEEFVVGVVQPNFTPGLGVLLAFSVSLGLFSIGLGGSAQSTYKENP
mmetsp:Transcript_30703/g.64354  ORF Transcript_30703/g.64354 Transcript_30703/m.64354 type:complete len:263 (-) Transcript_30703:350-1138(-)